MNTQSTLNTHLLSSMLKSKRGTMGLRNAAAEISSEFGEISSATLSRVEQGNLPDVETFIKLCKWLNTSPDIFIAGDKPIKKEVSEKDKLVFQLRSSKELDPETINAMISMVDMAFTTKAKKRAK